MRLVEVNNTKVLKDVETGKVYMQCGCGGDLKEVGSGGAASWNDLQDKPFDKTTETVKKHISAGPFDFKYTIYGASIETPYIDVLDGETISIVINATGVYTKDYYVYEGVGEVAIRGTVFKAIDRGGEEYLNVVFEDTTEVIIAKCTSYPDQEPLFKITGLYLNRELGDGYGIRLFYEAHSMDTANSGTYAITSNITVEADVIREEITVSPIPTEFLPEHLQFGETNLISWDGDTEGRDSVTIDLNGESYSFFKVSDEAFSSHDLIGKTISLSGVEDTPVPSESVIGDTFEAFDVTDDCTLVVSELPFVVSVKNSGVYNLSSNPDFPMEVDFPSVGTYVVYVPAGAAGPAPVFCSKIGEVKTINHKYLPNTGGAFRINVTMDDEDNYVADKTYAEVSEAIANGLLPYCVMGTNVFQLSYSDEIDAMSTFAANFAHRFIHVDFYHTMICMIEIQDRSSNPVCYSEVTLQIVVEE